jgi:hypothetical protein
VNERYVTSTQFFKNVDGYRLGKNSRKCALRPIVSFYLVVTVEVAVNVFALITVACKKGLVL